MKKYSVKARMSMVDFEDIAQAAAIVLTEPAHVGATYELADPEVLPQRQEQKPLIYGISEYS
jgi:uncharacterized protein YbjT (DUF2867 family)